MSLLLTVILILLVAYLYANNYVSGKTLIIILLVYIIFIILFSIGIGMAGLVGSICLNQKCDTVKLPLDITKIGQFDATNYVYRVIPLNQ